LDRPRPGNASVVEDASRLIRLPGNIPWPPPSALRRQYRASGQWAQPGAALEARFAPWLKSAAKELVKFIAASA